MSRKSRGGGIIAALVTGVAGKRCMALAGVNELGVIEVGSLRRHGKQGRLAGRVCRSRYVVDAFSTRYVPACDAKPNETAERRYRRQRPEAIHETT